MSEAPSILFLAESTTESLIALLVWFAFIVIGALSKILKKKDGGGESEESGDGNAETTDASAGGNAASRRQEPFPWETVPEPQPEPEPEPFPWEISPEPPPPYSREHTLPDELLRATTTAGTRSSAAAEQAFPPPPPLPGEEGTLPHLRAAAEAAVPEASTKPAAGEKILADREALRRAVLAHEILSPPLALRE